MPLPSLLSNSYTRRASHASTCHDAVLHPPPLLAIDAELAPGAETAPNVDAVEYNPRGEPLMRNDVVGALEDADSPSGPGLKLGSASNPGLKAYSSRHCEATALGTSHTPSHITPLRRGNTAGPPFSPAPMALLPPASAHRHQPISPPGKANIVAILRSKSLFKREIDSKKQ